MSSRAVSAGRRRNIGPRSGMAQLPAELKAINAELSARNLQQAAVASLGQHAIRDRDLSTLMEEAAVVTATTLGTAYSAVAEMLPDGQRFLVRSGVGWKVGVVGGAYSSEGTPVEYMLRTGEPVVILDVRTESRFPIPAPMIEHGVAGAIYVMIKGRVRPWGALGAYSIRARTFTADDIGFLQSVANVLALAVERHELEVAQRRETEILQAMFDNIPVTVSFFDASGRLVRVNREWERTLGWTLEEAQRVDILAEAYPDPDYRKGVVDFMLRADRQWADFRTRKRDGSVIDTSWVRVKLSDGSRIGFGLDLTERKRAERALAASEARFANLFEASPVALGMSTIEEGRMIAVNERWLEVLGYRRDEVIGRTSGELNISVRPEARSAMIELVRHGGVARNIEMQVRRKSGEVRDVMVSAVAVHLGTPAEYWISAFTDITDRKREQAERDRLIEETRAAHVRTGALSRKLLTAHEEERRRLAVELHDELGQVLTAVKINLESLARSYNPGPAPVQLNDSIASVDVAMHRVRDIALDLRPSVLDDLGLPSALRWYVDRFARDAHVEVHVSIDAVPDLDTGIATACFRVAQEALTNVARHARARHVWLDLHLVGDGLELRVRDDGVGFDVAAARQRASQGASMGLLGMQERVSLAGGEFHVSALQQRGTEVRAGFPEGVKPGGPS